MVPYQFLLALGHEVHTVSPGKKKNDKVRLIFLNFQIQFYL